MAVNDTWSTRNPDISSEDSDDDEDNDFEDIYETAEIAIPFALAVVVVLVLCAAVAIGKMKKRRLRRLQNGNAPFPAISGGVPMNSAAYLNHEFLNTVNQSPISNSSQQPFGVQLSPPPPLYTTPSTAIEQIPMQQYNPIPYSPMAEPPKYEDIYKQNVSISSANHEERVTGSNQDCTDYSYDNAMSDEEPHSTVDKDSPSHRVTDPDFNASGNKAFQYDSSESVNTQQRSSSSDLPLGGQNNPPHHSASETELSKEMPNTIQDESNPSRASTCL